MAAAPASLITNLALTIGDIDMAGTTTGSSGTVKLRGFKMIESTISRLMAKDAKLTEQLTECKRELVEAFDELLAWGRIKNATPAGKGGASRGNSHQAGG